MKTKTIVYNALLIAIVIILATVPNLGYIQVGGMAITIIHIPVIIAAVLFGYKSALLMGIALWCHVDDCCSDQRSRRRYPVH